MRFLLLLLAVAACVPVLAQECSEDLAAERTTCNARIDEEKKTLALRIKDAEVKAQQASTEQAALLATIHDLKAEAKTGANKLLSLGEIATSTLTLGTHCVSNSISEVKLAFSGLLKGNVKSLEVLVGKLGKASVESCRDALAFIGRTLDSHFPAVKMNSLKILTKACAFYKTSLAPVPVVKAAENQLSSVSAAIKRHLTAVITSRPALAPLNDTATIEFLSNLLMWGVPALAVLLPVFAASAAPRA